MSQIGCPQGSQQHERLVEALGQPDEHLTALDHANRLGGAGDTGDPRRLCVAKPVSPDPVVEDEVALPAVVDVVLEARRAEGDRIAKEREVRELRPLVIEVDMAGDAMTGDAGQMGIEPAQAPEVGGREGLLVPPPPPRLHVAMTRSVRAAEDVAHRAACGLVDVDEDEHQRRASGTSRRRYPSTTVSSCRDASSPRGRGTAGRREPRRSHSPGRPRRRPGRACRSGPLPGCHAARSGSPSR